MAGETGKQIETAKQGPFDVLDQMRNEMNRVFQRFESGWPGLQELAGGSLGGLAVVPRMDVHNEKDRFVVEAELPGVDKGDVEVSVVNGMLRIKGTKKSSREEKSEGRVMSERSYGSFERVVALADDVDPATVSAKFDNGVLTVTAGKRPDAKPETRTIEIQQGG